MRKFGRCKRGFERSMRKTGRSLEKLREVREFERSMRKTGRSKRLFERSYREFERS